MRLDIKLKKKLISMGLAFGLTVTAIPLWQIPVHVQAADVVTLDAESKEAVTLASVRAEARDKYTNDQTGFDLELSEREFNGGAGLDYSTDADGRKYISVFNNLRTSSNDQTVILRFKTSEANGLLFGAGANPEAKDGSSTTFGLTNGGLRFVIRNDKGGGLKGTFSSGLADGQWHTVAVSFLPSLGNAADNIRLVIDGGADLYSGLGWGSNWIGGLNQKQEVEYSAFQIGGGSYVNQDSASAAFRGKIDFLTVIDKAYTTAELQKITEGDRSERDDFSVMTASGTRNTWLFTGGTETVADFKKSGTARNYVGLFEDNLRAGGTFVERGRFVFNTAKRGADVAYILENYDTMIAPYDTKAVGIMVGASDYEKGVEGVPAFQASLQALLDKLYGEDKLPFIITPYPAADKADAARIEAYVEAIQEAAGKRTRVVNVSELASELLQEDGSLRPAGQQAVANAVKSALGVGTATNFGFYLEDGSYTVAKKTADGSQAQVKAAEAGEDSVRVSVDAASISQDSTQLSYVLKDSKGQEVSGFAEEGKTEFNVGGLKKGETYTIYVYDESRGEVKESYRPVSIRVAAGEKGVSLEYADGNTGVNAKIQSLLTSEEPVTYLFMGDSITHGIVTLGYDNVPQLFAKYLDELGRAEDVVLNTGVSNATIMTTLDQIDARLEKFDPNVVMVMLGTNDTSYNGENIVTNGTASRAGITVEQFKDRYKELVRKIHDNNADTSIVLRVPCEMIVDDAHRGYEEKFAAITDVAEEMRQEIPGLNIAVVNHREEWLRYKENVRNDNIVSAGYSEETNKRSNAWLVDNVHPNGRGNLAMFQQIIRELGLYSSTSELANYQYTLSEWTGTSEISAPVTQRATRASLSMSALSNYAGGLKEVTLTLTADGVNISRSSAYAADGVITVDGLDAAKSYTAKVTGKDASNSKEITFQAALTRAEKDTATGEERKELTDSIAEARKLDVSSYPAAVSKAYAEALQKIEDTCIKDGMTVEDVDEALAQVRLARINLEKMADAAEADRRAAKAELDKALAASEARHQAGKTEWTEESWKIYDAAYQAAKAADGNTDTAVLKQLLANLKAAEASLTVKTRTPGLPPVQPKETIEEGKVYDVGIYCYKVTSTAERTVEVAGFKKAGSSAKIVIGNTVKLDGKDYKITSIGAASFKGNKKVTSAVIGKNVQTVGKNAFAGCVKLKKVTGKGGSLKKIGAKAFFNCKALKSIVIKSKALKSVGKNAFRGINKKAVIKVPSAKVKAYAKLLAKKGQSATVKIK